MNTFPESIKARIEDEAEASAKKGLGLMSMLPPEQWKMYLGGHIEGYTAAAESILGNPEAWGLAVKDWTPVEVGLPPKFKNVLGLSKLGKIAITCVDASDKLDEFEIEVDQGDKWTHWPFIPPKPGESATPSSRVRQLEQTLKKNTRMGA